MPTKRNLFERVCMIGMSFAVICGTHVQAQPVCGTVSGLTMPDPGPFADNYLTGTFKCVLTSETPVPPYPTTRHCSDNGGIEATFSDELKVYQASVQGGGWRTWSSPPFAERNNPFVGYTHGPELIINLTNGPIGVLGWELEPNAFAEFAVTAEFFDGPDGSGQRLAAITQPVNGVSGARLFAAVCSDSIIQSAKIRVPPEAAGYAIAQLRSDYFAGIMAPEPPDVGPVITDVSDAAQNTDDPPPAR